MVHASIDLYIGWLAAAWDRAQYWLGMNGLTLAILLFSEVAAHGDWMMCRNECGTWLFWRKQQQAGWHAGWLAGRLLRSCSSDCLPTKQRPHSNDPYLIVWFPTLDHNPYEAQWVTFRPRSDFSTPQAYGPFLPGARPSFSTSHPLIIVVAGRVEHLPPRDYESRVLPLHYASDTTNKNESGRWLVGSEDWLVVLRRPRIRDLIGQKSYMYDDMRMDLMTRVLLPNCHEIWITLE